jgi:2-dehydro-3-deoxygluconokinase
MLEVTETETGRALCLGEAMVVLRPDQPGGLRGSDLLRRSVGGAEANVAGALATMGVHTTWVSRLGSDPFGDYVEHDLNARGVTVLAERDDDRPTGAYLKDSGATGSRMYYYRTGSAATVMDRGLLAAPAVAEALGTCEVVHTSGITAGLLAEDSEFLPALVEARDRHGFTLSVDLNWRPALWRGRDAHSLRSLLRAADVVLLGVDEATIVLGTDEPTRLREQVGPRPRLVVKSDAYTAAELDPDGTVTEVPALSVDIVEPVGAGDGFAAGYLAGTLAGHDATGRLRLGHLTAASVLAEPGDHALLLPGVAVRRALLEATADEWRATRVTAAGVGSACLPTSGGTW